MNTRNGFAPIIILFAIIALLAAGTGRFVLVSKNKTSSPQEFLLPSPSLSPSPSQLPLPSLSPSITTASVSLPSAKTTPPPSPVKIVSTPSPLVIQTPIPKIEVPFSSAPNPPELFGWWEEEGSFPFYREFTKNYFCNNYDAKFHCVKNDRYTASGDTITYEGAGVGLSEKWKLVDGKLEITQFSGGRQMGNKSVYKKVSEPTSPDRKLPGLLQANLELIKANKLGICLRHNGGDIIYISDIELTVDGKIISTSALTFGQFPKFQDFLFSSGESLVLPGTFNAGSRISFKLARNSNIVGVPPSFVSTSSSSWTIETLLVVEPYPTSANAPYWFGFASCP